MRPKILLPAALLLVFLAWPASGTGDLTVLYPPDLTLTTDAAMKILASRIGGGPAVYVRLNGKVVAKLEGENFLKAEVSLAPGFNLLEAGEKPVRVFLLSGSRMEQFRLTPEGGGEPLVFRSYFVHPALDEGCESCHAVEGGKLTAKDLKEACYACHADFGKEEEGKKVYLHAPVAAGECTGCHDPHFSTRAKLQKLEKGCLECHDAFPAEGTTHRPVVDGRCTDCHGAHAGAAPKQLVRPGNALCAGCHEDPHAQHRSSVVKGKMTLVPSDFPREKEALACLGCHFPHQSPERRLFRKSQGELCKTCHQV